MNSDKYSSPELYKLFQYLVDSNYLHVHNYTVDRYRQDPETELITKIAVYDETDKEIWDAVCNSISYGNKIKLLEVSGSVISDICKRDGVEGFLTADEIISRIK